MTGEHAIFCHFQRPTWHRYLPFRDLTSRSATCNPVYLSLLGERGRFMIWSLHVDLDFSLDLDNQHRRTRSIAIAVGAHVAQHTLHCFDHNSAKSGPIDTRPSSNRPASIRHRHPALRTAVNGLDNSHLLHGLAQIRDYGCVHVFCQ